MTLARNFGEGEYYHVYNRGFGKNSIVHDDTDRKRLLFAILYSQSPHQFVHIGRYVKKFESKSGFPVEETLLRYIQQARFVELVAFCLMNNHFHLIVRERVPGGVSLYLQKITIAHTRYMNTRYQTSGHLFEGRFKAKHIPDNNYLLYLSAYIHRNPRELKAWKNKEFEYPWSSLQDFTEANRWGGLLMSDIIADQFESTPNSNYKDFVKTSTAKILKEELGLLGL